MDLRWLDWAKQMQSIAQAGLEYSKDIYDIERFGQLRELSVEIVSSYTGVEHSMVRDLFANETGYATPKVDVRGVIVQDGKILMVKETTDGKWSLPGGWADVGLSPKEVVVKEVREESGFDVVPTRLLAVLDKKHHVHPPSPYHIYKIFIQCVITGGRPTTSVETDDIGFFSEDNLPELSESRITQSQMTMLFEQVRNEHDDAIFD